MIRAIAALGPAVSLVERAMVESKARAREVLALAV